MKIDLLARALDHPHKVFVECKALRDALPADTISKLLGNVTIRGADAGWLFSTSELTKDGRGQWEDLRANPDLAKRFSWYAPARLIEMPVNQGTVIDPARQVTGPGGAVECGKGKQGCGDSDKKLIEETKVYSEAGPRPVRVGYAKAGAKRSPDHGKQWCLL